MNTTHNKETIQLISMPQYEISTYISCSYHRPGSLSMYCGVSYRDTVQYYIVTQQTECPSIAVRHGSRIDSWNAYCASVVTLTSAGCHALIMGTSVGGRWREFRTNPRRCWPQLGSSIVCCLHRPSFPRHYRTLLQTLTMQKHVLAT